MLEWASEKVLEGASERLLVSLDHLPLLNGTYWSSVQCSGSVMSDSLRPHGLQHARPPCPSPTPGVYPNSCSLSQWCHPNIYPQSSPSSPAFSLSQHGGLSNDSALHIRWPKDWSFSFNISPSNEYTGLISLRMDWMDLLTVQGTLKMWRRSQ